MITNKHPDGPESIIKLRVDQPSGTIILNRPQHCNALSREMITELRTALEDLHQQRSVRAVILTGSKDIFSAGSDLHEIQATRKGKDAQQQWFADATALCELLETMLRFPKPIIAAVNGPALAAGLGLVLACDLVVAAPQATLGLPEARRGLVAGVVAPLANFRVGASWTANLLLRAAPLSVQGAQQIGLVHEVVPPELVWARAHELAQEIAESAPEALALAKRVLYETVGESLLTTMTAGAAAMAAARTTEAAAEGVDAFLEKRPPHWP